MNKRRCSDEANSYAFLASSSSEPQSNVRFAGTTVVNGNDVLIVVDIITTCQFSNQHLVQEWQGFEVEAVQTFVVGKRACLIRLSTIRCS